MTTRETLVKMREVLVAEGWNRGRIGGFGTPKCIYGAHNYVTRSAIYGSNTDEVSIALMKNIDVLPTMPSSSDPMISSYNPQAWYTVCGYNNAQDGIEPILEWIDATIASIEREEVKEEVKELAVA